MAILSSGLDGRLVAVIDGVVVDVTTDSSSSKGFPIKFDFKNRSVFIFPFRGNRTSKPPQLYPRRAYLSLNKRR